MQVTGVATPLKIQKLKLSDKAKQKTEEMKREKEKRESVERLFDLIVCLHTFIT